jgi:hypothetical protein
MIFYLATLSVVIGLFLWQLGTALRHLAHGCAAVRQVPTRPE